MAAAPFCLRFSSRVRFTPLCSNPPLFYYQPKQVWDADTLHNGTTMMFAFFMKIDNELELCFVCVSLTLNFDFLMAVLLEQSMIECRDLIDKLNFEFEWNLQNCRFPNHRPCKFKKSPKQPGESHSQVTPGCGGDCDGFVQALPTHKPKGLTGPRLSESGGTSTSKGFIVPEPGDTQSLGSCDIRPGSSVVSQLHTDPLVNGDVSVSQEARSNKSLSGSAVLASPKKVAVSATATDKAPGVQSGSRPYGDPAMDAGDKVPNGGTTGRKKPQ